MGRINLSAQRVRQRALANLKANKTQLQPIWEEIIHNVPPAQIMTRQQPTLHPLTRTRTHTLPDGTIKQTTTPLPPPRKPKSFKPSKIYSPTPLRYEEDSLRKQFFSDHPWELARPRVVLETTGNQHSTADWSTGLEQPSIPLSGESVVQRQLHLLQTTPDLTVPESYDIARKEFYTLRRRQTTNRRIATEEAEMLGANFGAPSMSKAMTIEDKMHDNWERWAEQQNMEMAARNAAFSGQQMQAEKKMLGETANVEGVAPSSSSAARLGERRVPPLAGSGMMGQRVFAAAERQKSLFNIRNS